MSTPQWQGPEWYDAAGRNRPLRSVRSGRDDRDERTNRVSRRAVRIGDSERDRAVESLGEHFVAGRLTQDEFEERSETATRARYADELEPLFEDLPVSGELQVVRGRHPQLPPPIFLILPFLMVGLVVTAVTLAAPWLLWGVFWVAIFSGMNRRRHHHRRPGGTFPA
ncbi:DUF1707 domain-containing protein [Kribbella antibiotica]|uniref:DUF1707 domain-containing protein n=1 Tax=Kribbella antibiotica TaxID=190195 RepID=A0A4R4ZU43_9ACTN|nr:DUF1707 domain-containing protein [Kribbella antibiotica]TDD61990.1 DUF1707 domain-containing protein [Kribbella antibiotica]